MNEERSFLQWMRETNNLYTGDGYHFRLGVFMTTLRYIEDFNRDKSKTYRLGLNHLSALTRAEYLSMLGTRSGSAKRIIATGRRVAPEQIDWREKGVVNEIKDQGQCGSCWAFGAIQTCESSWAIKNGKLLSFSESNIVDCCRGCFGCGGGWPYVAIDFVVKDQDGQFNSEEDYPYMPIQGDCRFDKSKAVGSVSGYVIVNEDDEHDLKEKIGTLGPASVSINASPSDFHTYSSGIYSSDICDAWTINHAVGCVGYGNEAGNNYWIIRNSWGTVWGEAGYMRLAMFAGNMCGIAAEAIVATV